MYLNPKSIADATFVQKYISSDQIKTFRLFYWSVSLVENPTGMKVLGLKDQPYLKKDLECFFTVNNLSEEERE